MATPHFIITAVGIMMCKFVTVLGSKDYAVLDARSEAGSTLSVCVMFNNQHQHLPSSIRKAHFHRLANLSHITGCNASDYITSPVLLEGKVVAVKRGGCTFIQKARMVQNFNAASVLVVDYKSTTIPTYPSGNESNFASINITLAVIAFDDYISLLSLSKLVHVAMYVPSNPLWDTNMILMIVLSTVLVMTGAAWSAYDEWQLAKVLRHSSLNSHDSEDSEKEGAAQKSDPEITYCGIMMGFVLICVTILLLYFFYDYIVYLFIAVFCIAGIYSLYHCLLPIWSRFLPVTYDIPVDRLPCISSKVKLRSFLLLLLCATIGIFWAIERHEKWAWIFQDLMGVTFCIFFIHTLHLPNLKIIVMFLILLLIYDVFFVFITPFFTNDGNSIMESVATGGRGHSKESLPMIFLLPTLSDFPIRKCIDREFSMLGFGDVVVPGLLITYNATFDVKTGTKMVYFICSSFGYFIGMIICIISLVYMNSAQPALLYLVPGTLITTICVALVRKEFRVLFFGLPNVEPKSNEQIESRAMGSEGEDVNMKYDDEEEKNLVKQVSR